MYLTDLINLKTLKQLVNIPKDKEYPFTISDGQLFLNKNYSKNPDSVLIDSTSITDNDIVGHTHYLDTQPGRFSLRDILTAKKHGNKILLYHTETQEFDYFDPNFPHPYPLSVDNKKLTIKQFLGLRYEPVRCDCYSFTRDVAKAIYSLDLPDIFKENIKYTNLKKIFLCPEQLGFKRVFDFKPGNFVLMNLSVDIPFHMGILIGERMILHSLSEKYPTGLLNLDGLKKNILGVYEFPC
jgi:hypothetical protein